MGGRASLWMQAVRNVQEAFPGAIERGLWLVVVGGVLSMFAAWVWWRARGRALKKEEERCGTASSGGG